MNEASLLERTLSQIDHKKIPNHVAIIMDGNRRWAKQVGISYDQAYWEGGESLVSTVDAAIKVGVNILTVFAFSTENWNRPKEEVEVILRILEEYLCFRKDDFIARGVRFSTIGRLETLPKSLREMITDIKQATKEGNTLELVIAINYGGKDEILRATKQLMHAAQEGKIELSSFSEEDFIKALEGGNRPPPDLLIRTSGEVRLSNFLLWHLAYTEIAFLPVLWPHFREQHFFESILEYQSRQRRLGKQGL